MAIEFRIDDSRNLKEMEDLLGKYRTFQAWTPDGIKVDLKIYNEYDDSDSCPFCCFDLTVWTKNRLYLITRDGADAVVRINNIDDAELDIDQKMDIIRTIFSVVDSAFNNFYGDESSSDTVIDVIKDLGALPDTDTIVINNCYYDPDPCERCTNNPKNGGSGICFCTLAKTKFKL